MLQKLICLFVLTMTFFQVNGQDCPDVCEARFPEKQKGEKECLACQRFWMKTDCEVESYRLTIFNRWGVNVYETDDPNEEITFRGLEEEGVYVWVVDLTFCNGKDLTENGKLIIYK